MNICTKVERFYIATEMKKKEKKKVTIETLSITQSFLPPSPPHPPPLFAHLPITT
jgi:hypothetical protein